ncbi:MAG: glycerol-3-phosphate acyltransferase [Chitinophagales bacterium]
MTAPLAPSAGYLALFLVAYLLGSVSFSYLAVRLLRREDLRALGSGNLGALNAARRLGKAGFLLVFLGDAGKAYLAVEVGRRWLGTDLALMVAAGGALVGHAYSLFLGFSGGKGLASAVGILLAWSPPALLAVALLALVFLAVTRDYHVAPALAAVCFPALAWLFWHSARWVIAGALLAALIVWRHRRSLASWAARLRPTPGSR